MAHLQLTNVRSSSGGQVNRISSGDMAGRIAAWVSNPLAHDHGLAGALPVPRTE